MSAGRLEELRERALGIGTDPAEPSDGRGSSPATIVTEPSGSVDVKGEGDVETWRLIGSLR